MVAILQVKTSGSEAFACTMRTAFPSGSASSPIHTTSSTSPGSQGCALAYSGSVSAANHGPIMASVTRNEGLSPNGSDLVCALSEKDSERFDPKIAARAHGG